jgi:metallo-beta-lactamase family protein
MLGGGVPPVLGVVDVCMGLIVAPARAKRQSRKSPYYPDLRPDMTEPSSSARACRVADMGITGGGHCLLAALDRASSELHALSPLDAAGESVRYRCTRTGLWPWTPEMPIAAARSASACRAPHLLAPLMDLPDLHTAHSAWKSMPMNEPNTPSMTISASGMTTGPRLIHHLSHMLPDPHSPGHSRAQDVQPLGPGAGRGGR